MKGTILLSGLLSLVSFSTFSQTAFGLKAGGNLSTADFKNNFGNSHHPTIGYHIGGIAERNISQKTFVRTELFLSLKGYEVRSIRNPGNGLTTIDRHYLGLPLLVGYRLTPSLSLLVGPEVGYTLGNTAKPKTNRDFDFGLDGSMLYHFTDALSFDLRCTYGLVKMTNVNSVDDGSPVWDGQNRVAQLGVNYLFRKR